MILSGVRTPVGRYGGVLSGERPDDLAALVIRGGRRAMQAWTAPRSRTSTSAAANQAGEDNRNVARMAAARRPARLGSQASPSTGSAPRALRDRLGAVMPSSAGDGDLYVAGGVESMSRAPLRASAKPEHGFARGDRTVYDTTLGVALPEPALEELFSLESMGETGENVAERYGVSREEQDAFALAVAAALGRGARGGALRRRARPGRRGRARRASAAGHDEPRSWPR